MSKNLEIWYEPHPVTPERKAELRAKGYRIVDAQFAPLDWREPAEDGQGTEPPKANDEKPARQGEPEDFSDEQLREEIKAITGKAPHWKASRETLLQQYAEL